VKRLNDILKGIHILRREGPDVPGVDDLTFDSRNIQPGCMFVAIKGTHTDGHSFIDQAVVQGAGVVVCEMIPERIHPEALYLQVESSSLALGQLASNYYDHPSLKLKLIGITGTNGKTTIATLLYRLFLQLGRQAGLISTIEYYINDRVFPSTHTTPDPIVLNRLLDEMVKAGCSHCFMEVSSHGIAQGRIAGLEFRGGIFTNLTHDHLDYHVTFRDYLLAKKKFFDALPSGAFALTNADDRNGTIMVQNTPARIYTYALKSPADYMCKIIESNIEGLELEFDKVRAWFRLVGEFNGYNLLAVYAAALLLDEDPATVLTGLSNLAPVTGRFETLRSNDKVVAIIDYAHTPDALINVLQTIQSVKPGNSRVISVVGAGGDRDKTKRPLMGKIASEKSDQVILTSDNPRSEDPQQIIDEMMSGIDQLLRKKVLTITDRREAIRTASALAHSGDIILIAGKGHERYQEIKGVRHHFDDKEIIESIFLTRSANYN
jgi:UDP-N-acetylmuramoyl-L-alanyl-D-glutamate--2,6-diaminopimelate ligase